MVSNGRTIIVPGLSRLIMTIATLLILASPVWAEEVVQHIDAARNYMESSQWAFASLEWRKVLERDPENLEATLGLARALDKSGFSDKARQQLESAYKHNPNTELAVALADLYRHDKPGRAYRLYLEALKKDPVHPRAFYGLQRLSREVPEKARKSVERVLDRHAAMALERGRKLYKAGEYPEAARHLDVPRHGQDGGTDRGACARPRRPRPRPQHQGCQAARRARRRARPGFRARRRTDPRAGTAVRAARA
mgnify:CR=1 FL=1